MSVKFITCIYSDLNGTGYGGRHARGGHYKFSLLSLLKMTDADFLCYTSEREMESLKNFFFTQNNISESQLKFQISIKNILLNTLIKQIELQQFLNFQNKILFQNIILIVKKSMLYIMEQKKYFSR